MNPVYIFKTTTISTFLLAQLFICTTHANKNNTKKPNVLFICVDDLRPELGCYGANYIKSPNIDRLAGSGTVFTNHFVSIPTCGASRASILTGMYPRTKQHLSNEACRTFISGKPETEVPETFIHHLKRNGYYTVGIGKISHYVDGLLYGYEEPVGTELELPHSWNEMLFDSGKWGTGWNAFFGYADGSNRQSMNKQVKPYERAEVDDEGYPDGLIANLAVQKLKELGQKEKPFFLGVGFFKPHLPFNAPAKYWDLYDEGEIALTPSPNVPENIHLASLHNSGEFNGYLAGEEHPSLDKPASEAYQRKIRHAYFAAVSYVDAQIGKVLDELEKSGLAENTIIVLWGDHGWHLGDHRVWGKHTIFEKALKSALIMKVPGKSSGKQIDRVVSSVDIYPTLMELCQVEMNFETDGKSMLPLLENKISVNWEDAAWGYFNNGITLRTSRYRLTKYFREAQPVTELYDHETDPFERVNIAGEQPAVVEQLLSVLKEKDFGIYKQ
ncbi:MAG: sulfatase [Prolixibacteraceae bacterium]|jgi:arylsulfatase A-like enzyme|nr:sulfatase [Prolixibacteraceae bacterium]